MPQVAQWTAVRRMYVRSPLGERGILQVFDQRTGKLLCSKGLHISAILFIEVSDEAGTVITAGGDYTMKLWVLSR